MSSSKNLSLGSILEKKVREREAKETPAPAAKPGENAKIFTSRFDSRELDKIKAIKLAIIKETEDILSDSDIVRGIISFVKPGRELYDHLLKEKDSRK